jgi:hypothetical protein
MRVQAVLTRAARGLIFSFGESMSVCRERPARVAPARVLFVILLLFSALVAAAQDFGRNKVAWKNIDFSVLSTEHFLIYHYPKGAPAVEDAARMLEAWYARHAALFGMELAGPQKVILYDSFPDFQQANAVPGLISQGEGGVTESLGGRIVLPLTGIPADDDHVLGHELVHAFQFRVIKARGAFESAASSLPTWLVEGMAEYLSLGRDDPLTSMWMRDAILHDSLPSVNQMTTRPDAYFPYRFGQALLSFIDGRWGDEGLRAFFDTSVGSGVSTGAESALGVKGIPELSRIWKEELSATVSPQLSERSDPKLVGRTLMGLGGGTVLGPSISPDGAMICVFSHNDPFSMSLSIADAASGRILRTLGSTDTDARFDALHFINSSGGWRADSRAVAFAVQKEGREAIALAGAQDGRVTRVIPLGDLSDVSGIAWSPDGSRIALSATENAEAGIWLLDPGSGDLTKITRTRAAYLQPCWSPDGSTLAFSTDQGGDTERAKHAFGSMNIGIMNVATGSVRILSTGGATHVNPVFSPDGKSLYFVSNPEGVPDVYRCNLETGLFFRVTHLATGVSGLTLLSPCLSVATGTGTLALSVFNNRGYEVHLLGLDAAEGSPVSLDGSISPGADLAESVASSVSAGDIAPYRPSFQLLSASTADIGLRLGALGASLGGTAEFLFEDVLGNHLIDVTTQINGDIDTLGGRISYVNSARRFGWGIEMAHLPQTSYFLLPLSEITFPGADTAVVQEQVFTEQVDFQGSYPLSPNRRIEAGAGYQHIWVGQAAPVTYFQAGNYIGDGEVTLPLTAPLDIVHAGLALVGDYSFFGFTEPLKGYRYRLELDGDAGSLAYVTAVADARAYLYLKPFAVAVRALHRGRYFGDADTPLLADSYLGEPDLVRGYEYYSMASLEGAGGGDVPQIDRLFGSRIAVVNAELRLPVLGNADVGLFNFPWVPLTLLGFVDAGVAWTATSPPAFTGTPNPAARVPVLSAGAAVRINILNAAVLQIYYAVPFQRPSISGIWGFLFEPGW